MIKKYEIRIPENLQIILDCQEQNKGLVVKLNHNIWAIFSKKEGTEDEYGFQLLNPNNNQRGAGKWGLTLKQATRLINNLIKKPGFGYGKEETTIIENINKIIKKIKKTYVQ